MLRTIYLILMPVIVSSIILIWTATGDDGDEGTAAAYDVRFGTGHISAADWDLLEQVDAPAPKPAGELESLTVQVDSGIVYYFGIKARDEAYNWSPISNRVVVYLGDYLCGDANDDGKVNVSDVIHIANWLFSGGPTPIPLVSAEVNCDNIVNVSDAVWVIRYIFEGGRAPCDCSRFCARREQ